MKECRLYYHFSFYKCVDTFGIQVYFIHFSNLQPITKPLFGREELGSCFNGFFFLSPVDATHLQELSFFVFFLQKIVMCKSLELVGEWMCQGHPLIN